MAECCSGGVWMIYACSGAADVGEIADRVARKLRDEGFTKMSCLAAIGVDLSGYVQTAKAADTVIAIDGCPTACARKNFERIGITRFRMCSPRWDVKRAQAPTEDTITRLAALVRAESCRRPFQDPAVDADAAAEISRGLTGNRTRTHYRQ